MTVSPRWKKSKDTKGTVSKVQEEIPAEKVLEQGEKEAKNIEKGDQEDKDMGESSDTESENEDIKKTKKREKLAMKAVK